MMPWLGTKADYETVKAARMIVKNIIAIIV